MRDKTPQSAGQRLALPVCSSPGLCQHRGSLPDTGPGLWGWAGAGGAFPCRAARSPWPLWPWVPHHLEWGSCSRAGVHSGLVLGSFGVPEKHPRVSRWHQDKAEITKGSHGMWLEGVRAAGHVPHAGTVPAAQPGAARGWGLQQRRFHREGTLLLCSTHSPLHPTEELGPPCHPSKCPPCQPSKCHPCHPSKGHPARTDPTPAPHSSSRGSQSRGWAAAPQGHPCPMPCPRMAAQGHPQGVVTRAHPGSDVCGVNPWGLQLPQLQVMEFPWPEGPR